MEMERELKVHFDKFPDTLEVAWRRGIERLRTQTCHIIAKCIEDEDRQEDAYDESSELNKIVLQKQVRGALMKWTAAWVTIDHDVAMVESTAIPAEYVPLGKEGSWSDNESSSDIFPGDDSNLEFDIDMRSEVEVKTEAKTKTEGSN